METDRKNGQTDAPLLVEPRLDAKPWGGHRLEQFGLTIPPGEKIGEALVTAGDAEVAGDGTLGDLVKQDPAARLGLRGQRAVSGRDVFPLLVKLIDAEENLSIQVHPNDAEARPLDRLGKTEAWYILAARPGASLYLGLRPGVSFAQFEAASRKLDGSSAALLRRVEAKPGTAVLIPAGTVHALGAGVMVYEIQQPSDVTFRLDDWGRVDAQGNPREMHLAQGFAVARPEFRPDLIPPVPLDATAGERDLLGACRFFAFERITLAAGEQASLHSPASPQVATLLEGAATVTNAGGSVDLTAGRSCVLWAATTAATLRAAGRIVALRAWVPDLAAEIVAPARAAGASEAAIEALSGPLDDVRAVAGAAS
jgi:mannose-6-phosphate isomerase